MEYVNISVMGNKPEKLSKTLKMSDIAKDYKHMFENPILLALLDNELVELHKNLTSGKNLTFIDITDFNGFRAYQRSTALVMIYAAKEILGRETRIVVAHSINKNYYCEMDGVKITPELLKKIEDKMWDIVKQDIRIEKLNLTIEEATEKVKEARLLDKLEVLRFRRTSNVNFYKLDWLYDYFYGPMVYSTGIIDKFKLIENGDSFILQFPSMANPKELAELKPLKKITQVFNESNNWARILNVETVGSLNSAICSDGASEIIKISEALHEKKISNLADEICIQNKSLVLIAGPSSSGKTTFSHRLALQLRASGKKPHIISLDDYYVDRHNVPVDEFGKPDFETIHSIDVKQLNHDLTALLNGESVHIPRFNFVSGLREYKNRFLKLGDGDILVMEGIHGLNEEISSQIHKKDKFKIFISALTQLNMDDHNHISTTDTRLIRRIVRDHRHRGFAGSTTIAMWPQVLRGENKNIFPLQEDADAFFNSALVYEMCILKQYIEALLFRIERDDPAFTEARRLIKFLDSILSAPSEQVPPNSILREFIGGSSFKT